jgi:hypothetical protein
LEKDELNCWFGLNRNASEQRELAMKIPTITDTEKIKGVTEIELNVEAPDRAGA